MSNEQKKILELESLRGLAALLVVLYHLPKWHPILDINLIKNSYLMVELFFVISGFVIYQAYSKKIHTINQLLKFQLLRIGRLYPVHLLFLLFFLLIEIGKYVAVSKFGMENIRAIPFRENSLNALFEQVFLLQAILPNGHAITYNTAAWSISVEFYTYLVFGLIILYFKKYRIQVISIIFIFAMFFLSTPSNFGNIHLLRCFAGFFLGCLIWHFIRHTKYEFPKYFSLLILFLLMAFLQLKSKSNLDPLIFFITATLVTSLVASPTGWLNRLILKKSFIWLGEISYSIYMSHTFIIWLTSNILKRLMRRPEILRIDGVWAVSLSGIETVIAVLFVYGAVLFISQIIYTYFEKPLRDHTRHLISNSTEKRSG